MIKSLLITSLTLLSALSLFGQIENVSGVVKVRGMGDAPLPDDKPSSIEKSENQAVHMAVMNAVDRALELQSATLRQQYDQRVRGNVEREKLVRSLITAMEAETERLPDEGITYAKVKGSLDIQSIRDMLNKIPKEYNNDRSDVGIAVFFTVRRTAASSKSGQVLVETENKQGINAAGQENITDTGIERVESKTTTAADKVGVTERVEAVKTEFEFDPQMKEAFGTGLLQKLTAKGFESIEDGAFFDVADQMDDDMTSRGSLSKNTMLAMVSELQEDPDIEYCVYGNLDFSLPYTDPITGMSAVKTTMLAKVYRIIPGKKRPKFVGGIGPKSYTGKGLQEEDAKKDILEAMAPLAADEIVSALKNNDVID
jgi:hypothetical protein